MMAVKKGLGRGLDALLGDAPMERERAAEKKPSNPEIPIEFISPNPNQPRRMFNDEAIEELAISIKSRGLLQPILVRPKGGDNYEIVAGERRWRAAQKAKLHVVPVIIRDLTDSETAEIALIENLQRVDLNPVEEAEAYRRLVEIFKHTQEEIAQAVGKSRSHVTNIMRLLKLPARTLDALSSGGVSMGHARALLSAVDPDHFCALVMKHGLSVRETEMLVKREANRGAGQKTAGDKAKKTASGADRTKDADTRSLESDLATALGLEVDITHTRKGSGSVTINYLTLDQLDDICRRLMETGV